MHRIGKTLVYKVVASQHLHKVVSLSLVHVPTCVCTYVCGFTIINIVFDILPHQCNNQSSLTQDYMRPCNSTAIIYVLRGISINFTYASTVFELYIHVRNYNNVILHSQIVA